MWHAHVGLLGILHVASVQAHLVVQDEQRLLTQHNHEVLLVVFVHSCTHAAHIPQITVEFYPFLAHPNPTQPNALPADIKLHALHKVRVLRDPLPVWHRAGEGEVDSSSPTCRASKQVRCPVMCSVAQESMQSAGRKINVFADCPCVLIYFHNKYYCVLLNGVVLRSGRVKL